ncbi:DUF3253 domain-containing protein [Litoribacter populi]|uniref:DUF3253 domain-containing protein n=1 Tax=Litoribacter populi TaxID=2598460 RepID=UPI00117E942A|nr:DUF3253 domain-containing protein [Litoribacter populi]
MQKLNSSKKYNSSETLTEEGKISSVLESAIMEMGRQRGDNTFCPSEIARWIFPQAWREFMSDVQQEMMRLYRDGKISVMQKGIEVHKNQMPTGPVRIKVPKP